MEENRPTGDRNFINKCKFLGESYDVLEIKPLKHLNQQISYNELCQGETLLNGKQASKVAVYDETHEKEDFAPKVQNKNNEINLCFIKGNENKERDGNKRHENVHNQQTIKKICEEKNQSKNILKSVTENVFEENYFINLESNSKFINHETLNEPEILISVDDSKTNLLNCKKQILEETIMENQSYENRSTRNIQKKYNEARRSKSFSDRIGKELTTSEQVRVRHSNHANFKNQSANDVEESFLRDTQSKEIRNHQPRSSFWLKFGTLKKRPEKKSLWSHFRSPYDEHFQIKSSSSSPDCSPYALQSSYNSSLFSYSSPSYSQTFHLLPTKNSFPCKVSTLSGFAHSDWSKSGIKMRELGESEMEFLPNPINRNSKAFESSPSMCEVLKDTFHTDPNHLFLSTVTDEDDFFSLSSAPTDSSEFGKSREEIQREWNLFFQKLDRLRQEPAHEDTFFRSLDSINMVIENEIGEAYSSLRHIQSLTNNSLTKPTDYFAIEKCEKYTHELQNFILGSSGLQNPLSSQKKTNSLSQTVDCNTNCKHESIETPKFPANKSKNRNYQTKLAKNCCCLTKTCDEMIVNPFNNCKKMSKSNSKLETEMMEMLQPSIKIYKTKSLILSKENKTPPHLYRQCSFKINKPEKNSEKNLKSTKMNPSLSKIDSKTLSGTQSPSQLKNFPKNLRPSNLKGKRSSSLDSKYLHRINSSEKFSSNFLQKISTSNSEQNFGKSAERSGKTFSTCSPYYEECCCPVYPTSATRSPRSRFPHIMTSYSKSSSFNPHNKSLKILDNGNENPSKSTKPTALLGKMLSAWKGDAEKNFLKSSLNNSNCTNLQSYEHSRNWISRIPKVYYSQESLESGKLKTINKDKSDYSNQQIQNKEMDFTFKSPNTPLNKINSWNDGYCLDGNFEPISNRCLEIGHEGEAKEARAEGDKQDLPTIVPSPGDLDISDGSPQSPDSVGSSTLTVGGMTGRVKSAPNAKKVAPPTVPDAGGSSSSSSSTCSSSSSHRHSGSSLSSGVFSGVDQRSSFTSSIGEESASNPPPSPRSPGRDSGCDHGMLGSVTSTGSNSSSNSSGSSGGGTGVRLGSISNGSNCNGGVGNASPSHYQSPQFTFPSTHQVPQFAHLMCPKASPGSPHHLSSDASYTYQPYQHQTSLEDQGIDVQSPGRSSPGSGSGSSTTGSTASSGNCRNSTTSLDSGRASSSTHTHTHRLSGQSYDSGSILRHSYHSSSSSLGSMEQDGTVHVNIHELINNGVPDSEVLRAWLCELHFEEYYEKFLSAGYDMPTISRMTPEDLNAIGITKPAHRKKLKAEITRLNISDGLPDYIPSRLEEWLTLLRLDNYIQPLKQQNYNTVEQVTQITWEDLEDVGITKLGHQKKVMLAIKRAKDIMSGKKFTTLSPLTHDVKPGSVGQFPLQELIIARETQDGRESYANLAELRTFQSGNQFGHDHHSRLGGPSDPGGQHYHPHVMHPTHPGHPGGYHPVHPSQMHLKYPGAFLPPDKIGPPPTVLNSTLHYRPDVVAVNVRGSGKGRGHEEPIYGTYQTFHPEQRFGPQGTQQGPLSLTSLPPRPMLPLQSGGHPPRSLDDGDITPTNEMSVVYEGGGTLPRPRTANKYRPVAKVTAKTRVDVHEIPQFAKETKVDDNFEGKIYAASHALQMSINHQGSASTNNTPQGTPKKLPPPPPRRSNSISESTKESSNRDSHYNSYLCRGMSYGYMGVKNNLQPDMTPNLPPPPPAPQDRGNHQHLPEDFPPPPPPLTCITMANTASRSSAVTSNISTSSLCNEVPSSYSPESDIEVGFRPRRNESNSSFKSTSSTDSGESLPFANDNAGTIKQRVSRPHTGFSLMDSRSSPRSSPLSSPALRRKEGIVLPTIRQQPQQPPTSCTTNSSSSSNVKNSVMSSPDGTSDVLSDIGNMLANLTDELDAMLEQDLSLKNKTP